MMRYFLCILLAYLIGSLSPSALISKLKHKDLRCEGTGNLGATNTTLVFGKAFGFIVMIFDICKGFISVKIAGWILPELEWFCMLVGFFAIIGHCFPFYLKFKGGKGLAAFGGVILAYDPLLFVVMLLTGVIIVLIANSGSILAYYAALVFPIFVAITNKSIPTVVVCVIMSLFVMIIFIPNLKRVFKGEDHKSRDFLKRRKNK